MVLVINGSAVVPEVVSGLPNFGCLAKTLYVKGEEAELIVAASHSITGAGLNCNKSSFIQELIDKEHIVTIANNIFLISKKFDSY
jgi:hypothetical protein